MVESETKGPTANRALKVGLVNAPKIILSGAFTQMQVISSLSWPTHTYDHYSVERGWKTQRSGRFIAGGLVPLHYPARFCVLPFLEGKP